MRLNGPTTTDELVKQTSKPLAKGSADYFSSYDTHRSNYTPTVMLSIEELLIKQF